jgi:hypothetical protein
MSDMSGLEVQKELHVHLALPTGLRSNSDAMGEMIRSSLANGWIRFDASFHTRSERPLPKIPRRRTTTIPFLMKTNLFLIGVAISLAACSDAQILPTERSVSYHSNPPLVRKVQIALRNRGYYHDLVDGYLGEATGIAIQRFQIDHSIRVIPLLDPSLLVSLGIQSN